MSSSMENAELKKMKISKRQLVPPSDGKGNHLQFRNHPHYVMPTSFSCSALEALAHSGGGSAELYTPSYKRSPRSKFFSVAELPATAHQTHNSAAISGLNDSAATSAQNSDQKLPRSKCLSIPDLDQSVFECGVMSANSTPRHGYEFSASGKELPRFKSFSVPNLHDSVFECGVMSPNSTPRHGCEFLSTSGKESEAGEVSLNSGYGSAIDSFNGPKTSLNISDQELDMPQKNLSKANQHRPRSKRSSASNSQEAAFECGVMPRNSTPHHGCEFGPNFKNIGRGALYLPLLFTSTSSHSSPSIQPALPAGPGVHASPFPKYVPPLNPHAWPSPKYVPPLNPRPFGTNPESGPHSRGSEISPYSYSYFYWLIPTAIIGLLIAIIVTKYF